MCYANNYAGIIDTGLYSIPQPSMIGEELYTDIIIEVYTNSIEHVTYVIISSYILKDLLKFILKDLLLFSTHYKKVYIKRPIDSVAN